MTIKNFERPPKSIIKTLSKFSTSNISDALDKLRIKGGCEGIRPIIHGVKAVGPAFTVKYMPAGLIPGTVGDYIDFCEPGDVVVLDNEGRTYCTVWGDILTHVAKKRGLSGTVIDGVCRDLDVILKLNYPLFSRGFFMMTGKDRVEVSGINIPVSIANIQVKPGDVIVADDSGVVVVPYEKLEDVIALAEEIAIAEEKIREAVNEGLSLKEAREKYHYHQLQKPRD
ncbi:MAG: RraA family protein [Candidatus Odinarchaeia archaeon]